MDQQNTQDPEEGGGSQVRWLRSLHDTEALFQLMQRDKQLTQGLEAAEALVELGDVRGLDHLIEVLRSPSSYMRHEAAGILQRVGHPRGLRALQEVSQAAVSLSMGTADRQKASPRDEQLRADLEGRDTDELIAIWHEDDRSQWSDRAFAIIGEILTGRLGHPPPGAGEDADDGRSMEDIDDDTDPRIQRLWLDGDIERLTRVMDREAWPMQLEAAEALADLGSESALDFLIQALDDENEDAGTLAAEILEWLDLPRGNLALQQHGIEFESGDGQAGVEAEQEPPRAPPAAQAPAAGSAPLPDRHIASALQQLQTAMTPHPGAPAAPQMSDAGASGSPLASMFTGAVGGVLGLMVFDLCLYLLGVLPPLQGTGAWLTRTLLYYLPSSIIVGALMALVGRRVAPAASWPANADAGEGDVLPIVAALLKGAVSALVVDVLLFLLLRL